MIIVYTPGCWDLLHAGHVNFLERARGLGDRLVVGMATDNVIREDKGSLPILGDVERLYLLKSLRCVDMAVPYFELQFTTHLDQFKPDILAVGEDWGHDLRHVDAEIWMKEHGGRTVKLPYTKGISTTEIKRRIRAEVNP